jgi:mono/diheme cytochrome c family protein
MNKILKSATAASLFAFASAIVISCTPGPNDTGRQYAPQMYDDAAYESLKQVDKNTVNPGGLNMRPPARNTIARGKLSYYNHIPKEDVDLAAARLRNPLQATTENIEDGKVLYSRFCASCHGAEGLGDGLVGKKFLGVANLTQDRLKAVPLGHIYHVITNGRGRMMPHGTQVNPEERWKISMYVRNVLQGQGEDINTETLNVDAQRSSTDMDSNEVTGTENPSGGATENPKATNKIKAQE